jgi:hypothetical protein
VVGTPGSLMGSSHGSIKVGRYGGDLRVLQVRGLGRAGPIIASRELTSRTADLCEHLHHMHRSTMDVFGSKEEN